MKNLSYTSFLEDLEGDLLDSDKTQPIIDPLLLEVFILFMLALFQKYIFCY